MFRFYTQSSKRVFLCTRINFGNCKSFLFIFAQYIRSRNDYAKNSHDNINKWIYLIQWNISRSNVLNKNEQLFNVIYSKCQARCHHTCHPGGMFFFGLQKRHSMSPKTKDDMILLDVIFQRRLHTTIPIHFYHWIIQFLVFLRHKLLPSVSESVKCRFRKALFYFIRRFNFHRGFHPNLKGHQILMIQISIILPRFHPTPKNIFQNRDLIRIFKYYSHNSRFVSIY